MAAPQAPSAPPMVAAYPPVIQKPIEVPAQALGHAAVVGTEAASNAAVRAEARNLRTDDSSAVRAMGAPSSEPIDLLWFRPAQRRRVRVFYTSLLADLSFDDVDGATRSRVMTPISTRRVQSCSACSPVSRSRTRRWPRA